MSFPAIHYGNFGDEKVTSSSKINSLPLGIRMVLPDGREFVHARVGGTALVAGKVYCAGSAASSTDTLLYQCPISATVAVGATSVGATTGATSAVTKDQFADGYLTTASSVGTGIGYTYKIKANNSAAAASATVTLTLYETDSVVVAMAGATTKVSLAENEFSRVLLVPTGTTSQIIAGVSCSSAAASSYVWLQRKGVASVFVAATALNNQDAVVCSTATAGAVEPMAIAATAQLVSTKSSVGVVGIGFTNCVTSGYSQIYLTLD